MRPFVVLLGIVMGSTVSIAVVLVMVGVVFLLMPEFAARLAEERQPLLMAGLVLLPLAGVSSASFYGELRELAWRRVAHAALLAMLAVATWSYWPKA
jgi:hypothetical protein